LSFILYYQVHISNCVVIGDMRRFEIILISSLISFSINTGATFSPAPVTISSLILPVIYKFPYLSSFPTSPECK